MVECIRVPTHRIYRLSHSGNCSRPSKEIPCDREIRAVVLKSFFSLFSFIYLNKPIISRHWNRRKIESDRYSRRSFERCLISLSIRRIEDSSRISNQHFRFVRNRFLLTNESIESYPRTISFPRSWQGETILRAIRIANILSFSSLRRQVSFTASNCSYSYNIHYYYSILTTTNCRNCLTFRKFNFVRDGFDGNPFFPRI